MEKIFVQNLLRAIQDLIAPPLCVLCRQYSAQILCQECLQVLEKFKIRPPRCYRCGAPLYGRKCKRCHGVRLPFALARGAFLYSGPAAKIVEVMKYQRFRSLIPWMAEQMIPLLEEFQGQWLVPVPLHPARVRERGFSQTRELASAIALKTGLKVTPALERIRYTRSQTTLVPSERRKNVQKAFRARAEIKDPVILLDDVMTTGATVKEAAKALIHAGTPRVEVLVFAITPGTDL